MPDVVLVGEEVGHAVVGQRRCRACARGRRALVERVGPVLHAHAAARRSGCTRWRRRPPRRRRVRWCAGCASTRMPLSTSSPAASASSVRGATPIPTTTRSQSTRPSPRRTRSTGPSPSNASTPAPRQQLDAVLDVDVAVDAAELRAQDALERHRRRLDRRVTSSAALARGRRDLGADPARADDHHRAAAVDPLAQRVGVVERAQVVDAVESAPGIGSAARLGAGGEQQAVVGQPLAAGERDLARGRGRSPSRAVPRRSSIVVLVVEAASSCTQTFSRVGLAAQVLLGERRALVRALGLGADQHDAAVEALLAQRLGGLGAGEARRPRSRTCWSLAVIVISPS